MTHYRYITNVSHIEYQRGKLWCHAIWIDQDARDIPQHGYCRRIQGLTWGGLPVLTFWIDDTVPIVLISNEGDNIDLLTQDRFLFFKSSVMIQANDVALRVEAQDPQQEIMVEYLTGSMPTGYSLDETILPFTWGDYYPSLVWKKRPLRSF